MQDSSWDLTGAASTISVLVRTSVPDDSFHENYTIPDTTPQVSLDKLAQSFDLRVNPDCYNRTP